MKGAQGASGDLFLQPFKCGVQFLTSSLSSISTAIFIFMRRSSSTAMRDVIFSDSICIAASVVPDVTFIFGRLSGAREDMIFSATPGLSSSSTVKVVEIFSFRFPPVVFP